MPVKTALVTGASSGIGRSTAIALLKKGWNVILTARRDDALQETTKLATESGATGQSFLLSGSIIDEAFVKRLFAEGVGYFGHLDLLFNNAGIGVPPLSIEELSLETFQQVITVNLIGPFLCTREAVKIFKSQSPQGGNAHTQLAARHTTGTLQPDGRVIPEATFDVKHVADSIVHVASLPNDVTVLQYNIMCVPAH
ncbi:Glucose 1-dehydrogenase 2 [Termitomyces sp. J132]|nr:Glucose 1-dehydrogenase 2 [Termitomyces sp. J132]